MQNEPLSTNTPCWKDSLCWMSIPLGILVLGFATMLILGTYCIDSENLRACGGQWHVAESLAIVGSVGLGFLIMMLAYGILMWIACTERDIGIKRKQPVKPTSSAISTLSVQPMLPTSKERLLTIDTQEIEKQDSEFSSIDTSRLSIDE